MRHTFIYTADANDAVQLAELMLDGLLDCGLMPTLDTEILYINGGAVIGYAFQAEDV